MSDRPVTYYPGLRRICCDNVEPIAPAIRKYANARPWAKQYAVMVEAEKELAIVRTNDESRVPAGARGAGEE